MSSDIILSIRRLSVNIHSGGEAINLLDNIELDVKRGKTLGIVGESGCGKSMTALSIMRLLPQPVCQITQGEIWFNGQNLLNLDANGMQKIRGKKIAMIFQEPMTALNPVRTVGSQINEVFSLHQPELNKTQVRQKILQLLNEVGISEPERRIQQYPHELSGGMRQRIMIAMALACNPDILIADEPTTALDVTIQAQILHLIRELQQKHQMSVILITHDLGVIAQTCDDVAVMYAGRVIETCSTEALFNSARHPYTRGLLRAIPRLEQTPKTPLPTITGQVPGLQNMPTGCRFSNRCPSQENKCQQVSFAMERINERHTTNCIRWQEI